MTWVDIANLRGPQGVQGPVNVGLRQTDPIEFAAPGGFTFNLADGGQQTVNLPLATAQSAGLQSASSAYDSGLRDISELFPSRTEGSITVRRVGNVVSFAGDVLKLSQSGTFSILGAVPGGFRPDVTFNGFAVSLTGNDAWRIAISTAGNLSLYSYISGSWLRFYLTFLTRNSIPDELPGKAS